MILPAIEIMSLMNQALTLEKCSIKNITLLKTERLSKTRCIQKIANEAGGLLDNERTNNRIRYN